jgi:hypothetical protein
MLPMRARQILAVLAVVSYAILGFGYHRLSYACYTSRHLQDHEPLFPTIVILPLNLAFWPLATVGNALNGIDCRPVPAG